MVCYLVAIVLFLLTGFRVVAATRVELVALGLAAAFLPLFLHAAQAFN